MVEQSRHSKRSASVPFPQLNKKSKVSTLLSEPQREQTITWPLTHLA